MLKKYSCCSSLTPCSFASCSPFGKAPFSTLFPMYAGWAFFLHGREFSCPLGSFEIISQAFMALLARHASIISQISQRYQLDRLALLARQANVISQTRLRYQLALLARLTLLAGYASSYKLQKCDKFLGYSYFLLFSAGGAILLSRSKKKFEKSRISRSLGQIDLIGRYLEIHKSYWL